MALSVILVYIIGARDDVSIGHAAPGGKLGQADGKMGCLHCHGRMIAPSFSPMRHVHRCSLGFSSFSANLLAQARLASFHRYGRLGLYGAGWAQGDADGIGLAFGERGK